MCHSSVKTPGYSFTRAQSSDRQPISQTPSHKRIDKPTTQHPSSLSSKHQSIIQSIVNQSINYLNNQPSKRQTNQQTIT